MSGPRDLVGGRERDAPADRSILDPAHLLYAVTTGDAQDVAAETLGRPLTAEELAWIGDRLCLEWYEGLDALIGVLQQQAAGS